MKNNVTIYKSSHPVVLACWSRDIQEATRRLLAAKRPNGLPSSVSEQVLYFKHLYGAVAVMTATDYMAKHLRLKNTKGRSNVTCGIRCPIPLLTKTAVAAAAVAPTSSHSIVAL